MYCDYTIYRTFIWVIIAGVLDQICDRQLVVLAYYTVCVFNPSSGTFFLTVES